MLQVFNDTTTHWETDMTLERQHAPATTQAVRERIRGLYHMADFRNIEGIIAKGLCSHNAAHRSGLVREDISDKTVNGNRARFNTSDGRHLHDFAVMYFKPRNPMMYRLKHRQSTLVVIEYVTEILDHPGVLATDGNAACWNTQYFPTNELHRIDFNKVFAEYWSHIADGKRTACAEVLYPERVPSSYIKYLHVNNGVLASFLRSTLPRAFAAKVKLTKEVFFS